MTSMQTNPHATPKGDATIVTASTPDELSPLEAAIMDACNELHDARSVGDNARAEAVRQDLFRLIDRYDETDGDDHPNPAWARPNQRALALSAAGEVERAIEAELVALRYADTPRRQEISLDNLADRSIRVGRYEAAIGYFLDAQAVAPSSIPVLMTGAQALYLAGFHEEADSLFAALLDEPDQLAPTGPLGAYLDHEDRLHAMARDLPSLAALYDAWHASKATGGAA